MNSVLWKCYGNKSRVFFLGWLIIYKNQTNPTTTHFWYLPQTYKDQWKQDLFAAKEMPRILKTRSQVICIEESFANLEKRQCNPLRHSVDSLLQSLYNIRSCNRKSTAVRQGKSNLSPLSNVLDQRSGYYKSPPKQERRRLPCDSGFLFRTCLLFGFRHDSRLAFKRLTHVPTNGRSKCNTWLMATQRRR